MEKMIETRVTKLKKRDEEIEELFRNEARCPFCGYLNYRLENAHQVAEEDTCKHLDGGTIGRLCFYQEGRG